VSFAVRLSTHVWNPMGARRALLLHGLGSDGTSWWRLASELAETGYLVIAPDLRSHGASPAAVDHSVAALAEDVAALGEGWDLVVGHSLGGAIATLLLHRSPQPRAAVLVDPVLRLDATQREPLRASQRADVGHLDPDRIRAARPGWDERDVQRKVLAAARVTPDVVDAVIDHNDPWDVTDLLRAAGVRVHLLAADPACGGLLAPDLASALADGDGVTAEVVDGCGHSIHRERPDVVGAAIERVTARG
jgi:pimeloyl-ACP methyl ester carboxylesterase